MVRLDPVSNGTAEQPDTFGCDVCGRQEFSGIIDGTHTDLIPMYRDGEIVVCEGCAADESATGNDGIEQFRLPTFGAAGEITEESGIPDGTPWSMVWFCESDGCETCEVSDILEGRREGEEDREVPFYRIGGKVLCATHAAEAWEGIRYQVVLPLFAESGAVLHG